jgi:CPA1 family monovalent cation:H+ antiporter
MTGFEHALLLILLTTALSVIGRWLPWPQPITYVVGALAVGLWPDFPHVHLEPEFFFLCFVPPLLFSDGWMMPLREFVQAKRTILILAIGLVVFTTLVVGFVAHALVPELPLAMAFALGAVISPTDAVAVSAITERLNVPSRLTIVPNGESLMNDATGLVAFKVALAAMVVGSFSVRSIAVEFLVLALGGFGAGLVIAYGIGRARDLLRKLHGTDPLIEVTVSLMTPYAAYLAATMLNVSAILAVVAAGLYSGWRDPVRMDVETRQTTMTVWATVLFWLNGLAFVLLGLQFPDLLAAVSGVYSPPQLLLLTLAISGVAIAGRLVLAFPAVYLPFLLFPRIRRTEPRPSWRSVLVGGWAGMRGTITLAAALSIPLLEPDGRPFPARDLVIFLSFGTIVVTLLLQGTTLEALIHRLGLHGDDTLAREEQTARIAAIEAALKLLRAYDTMGLSSEETAALGYVLAEYEHRLAALTAEGETRASARRRRHASRGFQLEALQTERATLDDLWRRGTITDNTYRPLQKLLDHEEAMLNTRMESKEA